MEHNFSTIKEIGKRGSKLAEKEGVEIHPVDLMMSLERALEHGDNQNIDLDILLTFPDGDFAHDIFGIHNNLNRETGELRNCFLPRCTG